MQSLSLNSVYKRLKRPLPRMGKYLSYVFLLISFSIGTGKEVKEECPDTMHFNFKAVVAETLECDEHVSTIFMIYHKVYCERLIFIQKSFVPFSYFI